MVSTFEGDLEVENATMVGSSVSFDMQCLSLVDGFVEALGTGSYRYLSRFLSSKDISVLKVIYSYFANQKMQYPVVNSSNAVYLSMSKLHYLCLPLNTAQYGSRFDGIKDVKQAIFERSHIDTFKEPEESFVPYLGYYVSESFSQFNDIRVSLRKLLYLGLIAVNDDSNAEKYHCMSVSPTALSIDLANLLANVWYDNGYVLKYICYDEYVDARGMGFLRLVDSKKYMDYCRGDVNFIKQLVGDSKCFPLSKLPRNLRDVLEVGIKNIFGNQYRIVKVRDKAMLEKLKALGVADDSVRVGAKVLLIT
jgi:hypothetical protein